MTLLTTDYLDTKQYPASADRYLAQQQALQPGVVNSGDYQVAQRAVGANMSVDIAAGGAWVAGTSVVRQGLYHQVNDGTVNQAVVPADATNPRVDQVILAVNDSTVTGSSDTPTLTVVAGTPTAGATLANRSGVDPLTTYGAFLRLADVLVPAGSTSVQGPNIRDRRPWARGANWTVTRNQNASGGGDYVVPVGGTGTTIDNTNLQQRVEVGPAGQLIVTVDGTIYNYGGGVAGAATATYFLTVLVDGVAQDDIVQVTLGLSWRANAKGSLHLSVTPGSHVVSFAHRFDTGAGGYLNADPSYGLRVNIKEDILPTLSANGTV